MSRSRDGSERKRGQVCNDLSVLQEMGSELASQASRASVPHRKNGDAVRVNFVMDLKVPGTSPAGWPSG